MGHRIAHPSPAARADRLGFYLLKAVSKANRVYRLFEEGDRIAVAVSGGKDSATLLHLLQRWPGVPRLNLTAVHVTAGLGEKCDIGMAPQALHAWFDALGIESAFIPLEPASGRPRRTRQGPCFHCALRRRKAIFEGARRMGCNKVALGHHADDVAVTTLLNLIYQGRCETMSARTTLFDGAITLIRPLYLIEERDIVRFARSGPFPFEPVSCSQGKDARRAHLEELLRLLEQEHPTVKRSLLNAVERAVPLAVKT